MLGSIKPTSSWQLTICGKHPVAKDYFQSGSQDALLMAFSNWIEKGYRLLKDKQKSEGLVSWRFWAKGIKKDEIVCGVVKDNSDRIGRPFPILIAAIGILDDWKKHWELLPFALEKTMNQIEYLCAKRYHNFKHLEEAIQTIKAPQPLWDEYAQHQKQYCESLNSEADGFRNISEFRKQISERLQQSISVRTLTDQNLSKNRLVPLGFWHIVMKELLKNIPTAVFMSEFGRLTYMTVFMRCLIPGDFVKLWSDENLL